MRAGGPRTQYFVAGRRPSHPGVSDAGQRPASLRAGRCGLKPGASRGGKCGLKARITQGWAMQVKGPHTPCGCRPGAQVHQSISSICRSLHRDAAPAAGHERWRRLCSGQPIRRRARPRRHPELPHRIVDVAIIRWIESRDFFVFRRPGAVEWAARLILAVEQRVAHHDVGEVQPGEAVTGIMFVRPLGTLCITRRPRLSARSAGCETYHREATSPAVLVATFVAPTDDDATPPAAPVPYVGATRVATCRGLHPVGRCWLLLVAVGRDFRRSYRSLLQMMMRCRAYGSGRSGESRDTFAALALWVGAARAATCREIHPVGRDCRRSYAG